MKYLQIKILLFVFLLQFFIFYKSNEAIATESEFSQAFADFIEILHANTQTLSRGTLICLYGNDDVSSRIKSNSKNSVSIDESTRGYNYKTCRIVYVAKNKERFVKSFIEMLNQSGALTVATFDSFVSDGGMMFIDIGRRDFELTINSQSFKTSGVKLDSSVMALIVSSKTYR